MATKKKAVKPVKKAASSKKAAPVKKATKPAVKKAAPAKKAVAKKTAPAKKVVKPVAKKAAAPAKKIEPKKIIAKPVAKKQEPIKKETPPPVVAPPKISKAEAKKTAAKAAAMLKKLTSKPVVPPREVVKQVTTPPPFKKVPPKEVAPVRTGKVVIPEIKTKTIRKYEPDFTKSVLDTPMYEQTGPSQRYSDVDLAEFRDLINKKLDAAKKELAYLQGLITRKDEMGGDETDNRYMTMEDGSMSMEREQLSQMASRQITFIDHLEKAIMRIENKTYGICRVTGKLIDKARLRAVPHATLSIEAKHMQHK